MYHKFWLQWIMILIMSSLFTTCVSVGKVAQSSNFPGLYQQTLQTAAIPQLRYTISIPEREDTIRPYPLVMALHFGGQVTPFFGKGILTNLVRPALKELQAIIVAPDCPGNGWSDPLSEKAIELLLDQVLKDYPIDKHKIILVGYSMGAMGIWDQAQKTPSPYAAAIAVSGIPRSAEVPQQLSFPLYVIASDKDEVFPLPKVKVLIEACQSKGLAVQFKAVEGITHYETGKFIPALRQTIPWIKQNWGK